MTKCEVSFFDHVEAGDAVCADPNHRAALARRAEGAPAWSTLERRDEHGSWRDYVAGQPVHCGDVLELQGTEHRADDYGEFAVKLATGVRVRYEQNSGHVTLYAVVAGHEFATPHEKWMRFRWPTRQ